MTDVPLREYLERRLDALEQIIEARLDANDRAIEIHEDMLKDRLFHSNGLIEQMRQQSIDYARIGSLEALANRIEALERNRSAIEGKNRGLQPLQALGLVVVSAIISAVVAYLASGR